MLAKEELLQQSKEYETAVNELFSREKTASFLSRASELKEKLDIAAAQFQQLPATDRADPSIIDAEKLVRLLLLRAESLATANQVCRDSAKVLFQEAGHWGRHFSVVRMTVMTFTITTCTAILAWKWSQGGADKVALTNAAVFLWVLGTSVFWIFTLATYREVGKQRELLPIFLPKLPKRSQPRYDWASLVIVLLYCALLLSVFLYDTGIRLEFLALLISGGAFALIFCIWYRSWVRRKNETEREKKPPCSVTPGP